MKSARCLILPVLASLTLLCACSAGETSDYANIDPEGWAYGDTLWLDLSPRVSGTDTVAVCPEACDISVVVRHDNSYEYSNIWLQIVSTKADTLAVDTVNMQLADAFGRWFGKGIGVSYQCTMPLDVLADADLSARVGVSHIMRADILEHIEQIGLVAVPHKSK